MTSDAVLSPQPLFAPEGRLAAMALVLPGTAQADAAGLAGRIAGMLGDGEWPPTLPLALRAGAGGCDAFRPPLPAPVWLLHPPGPAQAAPKSGGIARCLREATPGTPAPAAQAEVQPAGGSVQAMTAAWAAGAHYTLGWPTRNTPGSLKGPSGGDFRVATELLIAIDREQPVDRIQTLLERSPTLTFRILAFLRSPACGLRGVNSLRQAIMMMGYGRLRIWAGLLMVTAASTPDTTALVLASVWRAHFMQDLGRVLGGEIDAQHFFMAGVFSLLDQLLGKPMEPLLQDLDLQADVRTCLVDAGGALAPYLDLARRIESGDPFQAAAVLDALALTPAEADRCTLRALLAMTQTG